jgi:hypothetical protein
MSKRQALGIISNNHQLKPSTSFKNLKQSGSNASLASTNTAVFNTNIFNDENEPPQYGSKSLKSTNECDFEIFQEDVNDENKLMLSNKLGLSNQNSNMFTSKSNSQEKENFKQDVKSAKEPQFEFERYDYSNEEDDEDEDEEDDDDEEEDDEQKEELEEEGISRLNALIEDSTTSISSLGNNKHQHNTSDLMNMMDSSTSTHNDSSSPMMLDDTIKFQTMIQSEEEDDKELDKSEEDRYEEIDEATRRKLELEQNETILMSCLEYKDDILSYMRHLEKVNRPKPNYMKKQQDITSSMRSILVDWLVEVCEEYKLNVETLYLAVNYTDRFLSQMSVLRGKLQLVGTASMYIASKCEEITPPDVNEFVYITDDTYNRKQVLRMEHLLLKVLDFHMNPPTVNWFLTHFLRFLKLNTGLSSNANSELYNRIENLAKYLAELTLIEADTFLNYLPSQIAASALYLAFYTFGRGWTKQVAEIVGYNHDLSELKSCIIDIHKAMQQAAHHPQQAIQEKYKQAKYHYVSLIESPKTLPSFIYQS